MKSKIVSAMILIVAIVCCVCGACGVKREKLESPEVEVYGREVVWCSVENAEGYTVYFNKKEYDVTECKYVIPYDTPEGKYTVGVMAYGFGQIADSEITSVSFEYKKAEEHGYDKQGFEYTLLEDKSGYEISRGKADESLFYGTLQLPDTYNGYAVKRIAKEGFLNGKPYYYYSSRYQKLNIITTEIKLPAKLESIGECAFGNYTVMERLRLPEGVTEIEEGAFYNGYNLTDLQLNEGLKTIGRSAFAKCALPELKLPQSLEIIGYYAFSGKQLDCNTNDDLKYYPKLRSIEIPRGVKEIREGAFSCCRELREITVYPECVESFGIKVFEETEWLESQQGGLIYLRDDFLYRYKDIGYETLPLLEVPESVKYIAGGAFLVCYIDEIRIPDGVKLIGPNIFDTCHAKTVRLPQDITKIEDGTFENSHIKEIILPETVKEIGAGAFADCDSLKQIVIPQSVEKLGHYVFDSSGLTEVVIPYGIKELPNLLFSLCKKLVSVTIPKSVEIIGISAFEDCIKLETIKYGGTMNEWKKIEKCNMWNKNTRQYVVVCTDGTMDKNGNKI